MSWFSKSNPGSGECRPVTRVEFDALLQWVGEINVEVKCLVKGASEQREYDFLIKEGWKQDEYRFWDSPGATLTHVYQDTAYKLARGQYIQKKAKA